jgi:hypothetical protein
MAWQAAAVHLDRCLRALQAAAIRPLVLKGAALAVSLYPDPALRPMSDLDLLVAPARWRAAARVLEALDFVLEDEAEHGAAFAGPGGVRIELHGALVSCPGLFPVRFEELDARSAALGGGFDGRRLGDEDQVLHLALHLAFQHGFRARLGQYVDVRRLLAGPLDGDRLLAVAADARAERPLAACLAVTRCLFGAEPEGRVARALAANVPARVRRWIEQAAHEPWRLLDGMPLAHARFSLAAGAVCRARLVAGTLWPGRPDGSREVSPWKALARVRRLLQHVRSR